ncbi:MAG: 6-phosphogluconolactonase [Aestuariivirga sp.]
MIAKERLFESRGSLSSALATDVANALQHHVRVKGSACLAVSGGSTPKLFFETLSRFDVPWSRITVTLVDERQVPETNPRSNARLVRENLLQNSAAGAEFVPLFENPDAENIGTLDVVVLGMGNDGHTASFFPGGDNLSEALKPKAGKRIVEMSAPAADEPRLTFTLPTLLDTSLLCLHIEGQEKRDVLNQALAEGPVEAMPVRAVLRSKKPLTLYWCP